jgi:undecaprenyl-diphosphatase
MWEFIQIIILSSVQGFTEFLPISSSGHLVLLQHWFGSAEGDLFLDVVLHCGTLGSVLFVYRREIWRLLRLDAQALRYLWTLFVATLPAVIASLLWHATVESLFENPTLTAGALLVTAVLLFSTRLTRRPKVVAPQVWGPKWSHLRFGNPLPLPRARRF